MRVKSLAESFTMPCFSWMRWDFILILKVFYSSPLVLPYGFIVGYNTLTRRRWRKDVAKCRHSAINHSGGSSMLCTVLWNRLMKYTDDKLLHTRLACIAVIWFVRISQTFPNFTAQVCYIASIEQDRSEPNNLKSILMADIYIPV